MYPTLRADGESADPSRRERLQSIVRQLEYLLPEIRELDKTAAFTLAQSIISLQHDLAGKDPA